MVVDFRLIAEESITYTIITGTPVTIGGRRSTLPTHLPS